MAGGRLWHVDLSTNDKTLIQTLPSGGRGCALGNGVIFVTERNSNRVITVTLSSPYEYSVASTGLNEPVSLTLNVQNNILYVAEFSANQVRRVFLDATNQESRKEVAVTGISNPDCPALTKDGKILYVGQHVRHIGSVWRVPLSALGPVAATDLMKIASGLDRPRGLLLSADDTLLYVAEDIAGKVHRYELVSGSYAHVTVQSGMNRPYGLALAPGEDRLIVSEYYADTVSYLYPLADSPFTWTPTGQPSAQPSGKPYLLPSGQPTIEPTGQPTIEPTGQPSSQPSKQPSAQPTSQPSSQPSSTEPSAQPSAQPSNTITCPAGKQLSISWSPTDEKTRTCLDCPAGTFSKKGDIYCHKCSAGYYASAQSSECKPCYAGFYSLEGASDCKECSAGTVSNATASRCTACPVGSYSYPGSSQCLSCHDN